MTLPTSGPLSLSDIRTELTASGISTNFSLKNAETGVYGTINTGGSHPNGTSPYAISEWYNYNNNAPYGWLQNAGTFETTSTLACNNYAANGQWYTNTPSLSGGVRVYTDSALTTPVTGTGNWIALNPNFSGGAGSPKSAVQIDASGYINSVVAC
jgi:hypothetical protein